MKIKIGELRDVLEEAFSSKDMSRVLLKHRRGVESTLTGPTKNYVQAVERALLQAGQSSKMTAKDLEVTIGDALKAASQVPSAKATAPTKSGGEDFPIPPELAPDDPTEPPKKGTYPTEPKKKEPSATSTGKSKKDFPAPPPLKGPDKPGGFSPPPPPTKTSVPPAPGKGGGDMPPLKKLAKRQQDREKAGKKPLPFKKR